MVNLRANYIMSNFIKKGQVLRFGEHNIAYLRKELHSAIDEQKNKSAADKDVRKQLMDKVLGAGESSFSTHIHVSTFRGRTSAESNYQSVSALSFKLSLRTRNSSFINYNQLQSPFKVAIIQILKMEENLGNQKSIVKEMNEFLQIQNAEIEKHCGIVGQLESNFLKKSSLSTIQSRSVDTIRR